MKLWSNVYSPNVKRVRVACAELGISPDTVEMDFGKGDMRTPEYLAKNPMGKVPTIEDDGYVVWESPAILYYLANKHGKLQPTDLKGRTEVARWMFWHASHYGNALNTLVMERLVKPQLMKQEPNAVLVANAEQELARFAPILNAHLEGKQWVCGTEFTIADIAIAATTEMAVNMASVDLSSYKHLTAWLQRVQARPSWK